MLCVTPKAPFSTFSLSPTAVRQSLVPPRDDLEYTAIHSQANMYPGTVNMAESIPSNNGNREKHHSIQPVTWSGLQMPQMLHESSSNTLVTPCGVGIGTSLSTQEPPGYTTFGYSRVECSPSYHHLPMHQELRTIPVMGSRVCSVSYPWIPGQSYSMYPIPLRPKPNVGSEALQRAHFMVNGNDYQYPDACDMFKTANLLSKQLPSKGREAHGEINGRVEVGPELFDMECTIAQFPQNNVIPVKLKVQDDSSTEEVGTKTEIVPRGVGHAKAKSYPTKIKNASTKGKRSSQSQKKAVHQCTICNKFYSRASVLKTHHRVHTGERPYKCYVCSRTFPQAGALGTHRRSHTGEKPYLCTECKRRFTHSSALHNHMRIHTGEKPFSCTWEGCGRRFSDKSTLTKHRRVHTGEKPFACTVCGIRFTQIGNMKKHKTKMHGASVKEPEAEAEPKPEAPTLVTALKQEPFNKESTNQVPALMSFPSLDGGYV